MSSDKPKASQVIKELAKIGWQGKIKGRNLVRSSLMMPINKIFDKLRRQQQILDLETLRAAIITEIFTYLERTADPNYPWKAETRIKKRRKVEELVTIFFDKILDGIYQGKLARLAVDEKDIKAAYLFYVRNEIKPEDETKDEES
jgi:CRISPR-associated protein Csc3